MKRTLLLLSLLLLFSVTAKVTAQTVANYDTVTIYDLQFVPPESLAVGQDDSPFLGDTIIVEGIMATGPRDLWIGARWSAIIVDEKGGPWNGLQVVQEDTMQEGTNFSALKVGYKVRFAGIVAEFTYVTGPSHTEIFLLDNPPVPVELLGFGYAVPAPMEVTCADLAPDVGEKYENCLVLIKNATIINNNLPGNQMLITDATGQQLVVDDWGKGIYDSLGTGEYDWPANGTNINIKGFMREDPNGTGFQIGPITSADITILTNPPQISDVRRDPGAPTSNDDVVVYATIIDLNGTVDKARLHYKIGNGSWQLGNMSTVDSIYSRTIPKQSDGTMVQYFVKASDNDGDESMVPGDTSSSKFFYIVRDAGLSIKDIQWTPFRDGNSPYLGYEVTVSGIVTASPEDFLGDYVIQSSQQPWSGVHVDDAVHSPQRGDSVSVTGTVQENYNYTWISSVTVFETLASSYNIEPLKLTTGQATTGSPEAESYEGMLLEFNNVIVSNPFPDASNYGEIAIDDGTGGYRVDDDFSIDYRGNLDSTFARNDKIEKIIGIGYYSFGNYKLEPRNNEDIIGHRPASVKNSNNHLNLSYDLKQNYPNPFNPSTTIHYSIGKNGLVELTIYNVLGQRIRTLVRGVKTTGQHVARWDGLNDYDQVVASGIYFYTLKAGDFIKTNKMVLLR